jgi:hypothetical protein
VTGSFAQPALRPSRAALRDLAPLLLVGVLIALADSFNAFASVAGWHPSAAAWTLILVLLGAQVQRRGGSIGDGWSAAWRLVLALVLISLVGDYVAWNLTGQVPPALAPSAAKLGAAWGALPPEQRTLGAIGQVSAATWIFGLLLLALNLGIIAVLVSIVLWVEVAVGYAIARLLGGQP